MEYEFKKRNRFEGVYFLHYLKTVLLLVHPTAPVWWSCLPFLLQDLFFSLQEWVFRDYPGWPVHSRQVVEVKSITASRLGEWSAIWPTHSQIAACLFVVYICCQRQWESYTSDCLKLNSSSQALYVLVDF